jgi:hypothetical protein
MRRKAADRAPGRPAVSSADANVILFTAGDFGRQPDPAQTGLMTAPVQSADNTLAVSPRPAALAPPTP